MNYAKDAITLLLARSCLKDPERLRWAGFAASIYAATETRFSSHQDQFPGFRVFPSHWAGRDQVDPHREPSSLQ